jgi:hypothetical protein
MKTAKKNLSKPIYHMIEKQHRSGFRILTSTEYKEPKAKIAERFQPRLAIVGGGASEKQTSETFAKNITRFPYLRVVSNSKPIKPGA